MSNSPNARFAEFNAAIQNAEVLLSIARCSTLQKPAIESLSDLKDTIGRMKTEAISEKQEEIANILLGYERCVDILIHELKMWVLLKQEDPDKAWNELVAAQDAAIYAVRSHRGFEHVIRHYRRLEQIEKLVFPPQVFVSSGMLIQREDCSICGRDFEDCDHLAGMPYMGKFCYAIVKECDFDHVAVVESPADKCCRVTEFDVDGGTRNRMTWRITPKA